ncbi:MAG TPA: phosphate ABC transporter substrate-binding protein, PhoT family, partial [Candidatus Limnocylindria bacterium]
SLAIAEADGGPFLPPGQAEVASGRYPLSRVFYIVVDKVPGRPLDPLLVEWMRFILSRDGQRQVVEHGIFDPLRAEALRRSLALLDNIG